MQERTGSPSTWTVHAPHCESPQPNLAALSFSSLRRTYNSGVSGAASTMWDWPLTVISRSPWRSMAMVLAPLHFLATRRRSSSPSGAVLAKQKTCRTTGATSRCARRITTGSSPWAAKNARGESHDGNAGGHSVLLKAGQSQTTRGSRDTWRGYRFCRPRSQLTKTGSIRQNGHDSWVSERRCRTR